MYNRIKFASLLLLSPKFYCVASNKDIERIPPPRNSKIMAGTAPVGLGSFLDKIKIVGRFIKRYYFAISRAMIRVWGQFFYHNKLVLGCFIFLVILW